MRWALNRSILLSGGAAVSAPVPGRMHDLRRRYWWMVAGRPLASLLSGAAAPLFEEDLAEMERHASPTHSLSR